MLPGPCAQPAAWGWPRDARELLGEELGEELLLGLGHQRGEQLDVHLRRRRRRRKWGGGGEEGGGSEERRGGSEAALRGSERESKGTKRLLRGTTRGRW